MSPHDAYGPRALTRHPRHARIGPVAGALPLAADLPAQELTEATFAEWHADAWNMVDRIVRLHLMEDTVARPPNPAEFASTAWNCRPSRPRVRRFGLVSPYKA